AAIARPLEESRAAEARAEDRRSPGRAESAMARSAIRSDLIARRAHRIRRLCCLRSQAFIERAGAKALQIDRDESKADFFELAIDGGANPGLEDARDPALLELQPRDLAMVAYARDCKAHRMQQLLTRRDLRKRLGCYLRAVRKARRQARRGGTIPGRQPHRARELANLGLGHFGFDQRMAHAFLARRLHPGAIVVQVVQVKAVH